MLGPPALDNSVARMGRAGQTAFCSWQWQGGSKAGSNPRPSRLAASDGDGVSGCASGRASSTAFARFRSSSFLSFPPAFNPGGAVINAASTRTTNSPSPTRGSTRRLPRCQPLSWLMHQVRSQVMVQFRGSTATLRVGRVLKPFASATLFCKAGSAAQVKESICALGPVLI